MLVEQSLVVPLLSGIETCGVLKHVHLRITPARRLHDQQILLLQGAELSNKCKCQTNVKLLVSYQVHQAKGTFIQKCPLLVTFTVLL